MEVSSSEGNVNKVVLDKEEKIDMVRGDETVDHLPDSMEFRRTLLYLKIAYKKLNVGIRFCMLMLPAS